MMFKKEKLNKMLRIELNQIILKEFDFSFDRVITITRVEVSENGFNAKVFVSDDYKAVVGTINLDFRSLYLNFECGVYLQDASIIKVIENDYQKTLNMSEEITLGNCRNYSKIKLLIGKFLWVFGPLM